MSDEALLNDLTEVAIATRPDTWLEAGLHSHVVGGRNNVELSATESYTFKVYCPYYGIKVRVKYVTFPPGDPTPDFVRTSLFFERGLYFEKRSDDWTTSELTFPKGTPLTEQWVQVYRACRAFKRRVADLQDGGSPFELPYPATLLLGRFFETFEMHGMVPLLPQRHFTQRTEGSLEVLKLDSEGVVRV